ncbi:MAG: hypothetical protein JXQ77_06165 [Campylobacterales bacterium]|nr:hypothetical protein [Campylobacterales bacterium]
MIYKFYKILPVILIFILTGCSIKQPMQQKSAFITLKTPEIRYADMGFISEYMGSLKVQIYSNAQPVVSLDIYQDRICMSLFECMNKSDFYRKVFHASYPDDTLEQIFSFKPIFGGLNLIKTSNGFTQNITKPDQYSISYEISDDKISFHDKINQIIIKVQQQ